MIHYENMTSDSISASGEEASAPYPATVVQRHPGAIPAASRGTPGPVTGRRFQPMTIPCLLSGHDPPSTVALTSKRVPGLWSMLPLHRLVRPARVCAGRGPF